MPLEDAALPPGRALEGVQPAAADEDQLIAFGELGDGTVVELVAQEITADAGGGGEREVELAEGGIGRRAGAIGIELRALVRRAPPGPRPP